eukprot:CAMPEP_0202089266 /NCGR_PEP_ID=MMETSP0964-20121228/40699_1 /ASSEMBLY_ACC=CAM_ASM_000500 /TAXON_ID=4773 /ORGANISM="Schizochytrium aggregatum, Strain ATCC28209" /LENGTH=98 /DNA_ID=CAMNT_0048657333 /DNA_START=1 /DNA_END=293 /DNA_ORIENTATION=-
MLDNMIFVAGGANMKAVLVKQSDKVAGMFPPSTRALLGDDSISFCEGKAHKGLRRPIVNFLSPAKLSTVLPDVAPHFLSAVERWISTRGPVDLSLEST